MLTEFFYKRRILKVVKPILEHLCIVDAKVALTASCGDPYPGFTVYSSKFFITSAVFWAWEEPESAFIVKVLEKDTDEAIVDPVFCYRLPNFVEVKTLDLVIELAKSCMPCFIRHLEKSTNN